jgi:hypothetical protein
MVPKLAQPRALRWAAVDRLQEAIDLLPLRSGAQSEAETS